MSALTYTAADFGLLGRRLLAQAAEHVAHCEREHPDRLRQRGERQIMVAEHVVGGAVESDRSVLHFPLLTLTSDHLENLTEFGELIVDGVRLVLEVHEDSPSVGVSAAGTVGDVPASVGDATGATEAPSPSAPVDSLAAGDHADGHVCPECSTGKHRNCDGTAWCAVGDEPVQCLCEREAHSW